jgi:hypothetical protein
LNVLVMFERSGVVRRAFRTAGHAAWSVDLAPAEDGSPWHEQTDAYDLADYPHWDLIIAHPPCTYLCSSGLHRNVGNPARAAQTAAALADVRRLLALPARIRALRGGAPGGPVGLCLENPVGCISSAIRPASQYIQPYQFGHDASKRTGLWLENLPPLEVPPERRWIAPRMITGTDGEGRARDRAKTYEGIAAAMAAQWGSVRAERPLLEVNE